MICLTFYSVPSILLLASSGLYDAIYKSAQFTRWCNLQVGRYSSEEANAGNLPLKANVNTEIWKENITAKWANGPQEAERADCKHCWANRSELIRFPTLWLDML